MALSTSNLPKLGDVQPESDTPPPSGKPIKAGEFDTVEGEGYKRRQATTTQALFENAKPPVGGWDAVARDKKGIDIADLGENAHQIYNLPPNWREQGVLKMVLSDEACKRYGIASELDDMRQKIGAGNVHVVRSLETGEPMKQRDCIMVVQPKGLQDSVDRTYDESAKNFIETCTAMGERAAKEYRPTEQIIAEINEARIKARDEARRGGVVSETHGMSFEAAVKKFGSPWPDNSENAHNMRVEHLNDPNRPLSAKGRSQHAIGAGFDANGKLVRSK